MSETPQVPDAPKSTTPLLPEAGAAGAPLTIVIAVLAFMASVALAGYFMVSRAAADWTGDLSGTVTVQIKGVSPQQIENDAQAVAGLLDGIDGVRSTSVLSRRDSIALLDPWIGQSNIRDDLPIPTLVSAEISPTLRRDLSPVQAALAQEAPNAQLDDHRAWNDRLVAAANRAKSLAFIVFTLIMMATVCVIVFAARAGLAANRPIVEVMHLVGATDQFIAEQVQRRYFALGLRGGLAGAAFAALVLSLMAAVGSSAGSGFFLPNLAASPGILLWLLIVPVILCLISSYAARTTVRRILASGIE